MKKSLFVVAALLAVTMFPGAASAVAPRLVMSELKSKSLGSDSSIDFKHHASQSNGNGVYQNDDSGLYYYRGVVDNNIIYANRCWQIMGNTADGAIKILYNGTPSEAEACENTGDASSAILNVKYGDSNNGSYVESNAKQEIDTWFSENLSDHIDELADTAFCNDTNYTAAHQRIASDGLPTFACDETHQMTVANGKLSYPVAMITADELMFSGAGYGVAPADGEDYYADTGKFQAMTQQSANKMFYNNSLHYMNRSSGTSYSANIRPVIAIASDSFYILGGSGTKADPFRSIVVPPVPHDVKSLEESLVVQDDVSSAIFGDTVKFKIDTTRKLKSITFTSDDGEILDIETTLEDAGLYSFHMINQNVNINVAYVEEPKPTPAKENPKTSDSLPMLALGLALAVIGVVISTRSALASLKN